MSKTSLARNLIGLSLLLGLLLPAQVVCPQNAVKAAGDTVAKPKAAAPATAKPAEKKTEDERVTIEHADKMSYDPDTKIYHLTGSVVFANKNSRLYCDQADYNEEADTAKATGHLRAVEEGTSITGDLMEADFGKKLTIVTGNVTVVTQKQSNKTTGDKRDKALEKPKSPRTATAKAEANAVKPGPSEPATKDKRSKDKSRSDDYKDKKTTITCERLEYYYADDVKKMIATPRVKAVQEDKTVWADQAVFEDLPRLVTLTGNVVLKTDKGDEMRCTKAVVAVDDDWVQAENISGVTLRKNKNEPTKPTEKPAEKPAGPPSGTPPAPSKPAEPAPGADKSPG